MTKDQARLVLNEARDGADILPAAILYCLWLTGDLGNCCAPWKPQAIEGIVARIEHDALILRLRRSLSLPPDAIETIKWPARA